MIAARLAPAAALAALLALGAPLAARAGEPAAPAARPPVRQDIFPLADVRPGLRGYGLTVKSGTHIERFDVVVVDIIRNYLVKQDVILIRCLGKAFEDHQVAEGMSGSPIYFDGRCAGALSYTWMWAKHALAGVTPIETMLAQGKRVPEGRPTGMDPPTSLHRAAAREGRALVPIGTPLSVAGFSARGREELQQALGSEGFRVCAGGSAAGAPAQGSGWVDMDARMEPGCALVVDLMRGDYTIAALGTCTFVDGKTVYGFGHSFQTLGETVLPMSVGYVYTIVASRQIAFKIGSAIRPVGALVQDRPSCVVGTLGQDARMVPIHATFRNAVTKRQESFSFQVTPNRIFFTQMVIAGLRESFDRAEATLGSNTKHYRMTVKIKGMKPWTYEDVIAGFDGGFRRQLIGLLDRPLNHVTERPEFESFDLDVEIEHRDRRAFLRSATPAKDEVRRGETIPVALVFEKKDGGERVTRTLDVRVPQDAPLGNYRFEVLGGDYVPAEAATPEDIASLPALYAAFYRSTEVVAVMPTSRVHLDLDGRLVRDVPLSSLPRLVRSPGGTAGKLQPVTEKARMDVPFVVAGSQTVSLRVVR
jgi:hypothetical protein